MKRILQTQKFKNKIKQEDLIKQEKRFSLITGPQTVALQWETYDAKGKLEKCSSGTIL